MATKKKVSNKEWPIVQKGNHLTVKTFENGRTELEWDDVALLKEIREATKTTKKSAAKKKILKTKV